MRADEGFEAYKTSQIELDRRAFRKRQGIRSVLLSCLSLLVLAVLIVVALANSEGWALVQKTYFSLDFLLMSLPKVAKGLLTNLRILFFSLIFVAVFSTMIAIVRTTRSAVLFPLRVLAVAYTSVFRGVPLIIILYLIGFGVPALNIFGRIPVWILATIAISIVYSAYVAEVIRAGIEAVHPSQRMAARALGFSYGRTMRIVILPQAIRKIIPALMNDFVALQKDVGLASIIGASDVIREAQKVNAVYFNYTPYVCAGLLFILLSLPFILLTDWYSRKVRRREQVQGSV